MLPTWLHHLDPSFAHQSSTSIPSKIEDSILSAAFGIISRLHYGIIMSHWNLKLRGSTKQEWRATETGATSSKMIKTSSSRKPIMRPTNSSSIKTYKRTGQVRRLSDISAESSFTQHLSKYISAEKCVQMSFHCSFWASYWFMLKPSTVIIRLLWTTTSVPVFLIHLSRKRGSHLLQVWILTAVSFSPPSQW